MKKFLLLAATAMTAMTLSAQLYVTGENVEGAPAAWAPTTPLEVAEANGSYTFQATGKFKMSTVKGEWAAFEAAGKSLDGAWNKGTTTATANLRDASVDIPTPMSGVKITYTVPADFSTITATLPEGYTFGDAPAPDFYLVGDFNGWNNPGTKMDRNGTVYTVTLSEAISGGWKINNGSWDVDFGQGEAGMPVFGTEYNVAAGGGNLTTTLPVGTKVTFNYNEGGQSTLLLSSGDEPRPVTTPDHLYLIGAYNDMNWDPANSLELTKEGTTFSISDINITGSANFSFATVQGTWDDVNAAVRYGAGTEKDVKIELVNKVGTAPVYGEINSNMKAFEVAKGTYDMTVAFAAEGITLTVTQTSEAPYVEDLVLTGSFNGWAPNDPAYKFTKEGETYTLHVDNLPAETELKVKVADDAMWDNAWGAGADATLVNNTPAEAWLGSASNFVLSEDLEDITITFVRSDSPSVAATITLAGTNGVEAVEAAQAETPAEYFNLQGIRVANPEAGQLYIIRQGNKVSKVIR